MGTEFSLEFPCLSGNNRENRELTGILGVSKNRHNREIPDKRFVKGFCLQLSKSLPNALAGSLMEKDFNGYSIGKVRYNTAYSHPTRKVLADVVDMTVHIPVDINRW